MTSKQTRQRGPTVDHDQDDAFPSPWLRVRDMLKAGGKDVALTIDAVTVEETHPKRGVTEDAHVVWFQETQKGLILNKTNWLTIAGLYGDRCGQWKGKRVALCVTEESVKGKLIEVLRVRSRVPAPAAAKTNGQPAGAPVDTPAPAPATAPEPPAVTVDAATGEITEEPAPAPISAPAPAPTPGANGNGAQPAALIPGGPDLATVRTESPANFLVSCDKFALLCPWYAAGADRKADLPHILRDAKALGFAEIDSTNWKACREALTEHAKAVADK